jgi:ABC-2 type transport system permease protein
MLAFAAQWVLPLLAAVVAGDIFANEDQHGTWKTILTRSVSRSQVFWAKTLTAVLFNLAVLVVFAATITDTQGKDVPNPVFEFDGAIDPNS